LKAFCVSSAFEDWKFACVLNGFLLFESLRVFLMFLID
jgi:hypothetical protein